MPTPGSTRLMVALFTDIVGSVAMKERLGAAAAGELIGRHDRLLREIASRRGSAEVLKDTGDGCLIRFGVVSDAVEFALDLQRAIAQEEWGGEALRVRVGLDVGEVSELGEEAETGKRKVLGLAVDLAARVMGLAEGGQVLMTRAAFDSARQYVRDGEARGRGAIRWLAHGPYLFAGAAEPVEVFEVGEEGVAPLRPPADGPKARRSVAAADADTLGWRPGAGLGVPARPGWTLERRLGEGGFGEVWVARQARTGERRVFKFCFDPDRVRALKRELTLFRVIRQTLGARSDIARLYDVRLDEAPYFLEAEFTEGGDLLAWAERRGGVLGVPMEERIALLARIADAVHAAHSVGVLHQDLKPANVLIEEREGEAWPKLADFGVGALVDPSRALDAGVTVAGFTRSEAEPSSGGQTRMYAPPEALAGGVFTAQGDIYALGVMLHQLVIGDLRAPLGVGWERSVRDPLLREDIAACVDGDPSRRLASARELADRLRSLGSRRSARERELERAVREASRRRLTRLSVFVALVLALVGGAMAVGLLREREARREAEAARALERAVTGFFVDELIGAANVVGGGRSDVTLLELLEDRASDAALRERFEGEPEAEFVVRMEVAETCRSLGRYGRAVEHAERALELAPRVHGARSLEAARAMATLAHALRAQARESRQWVWERLEGLHTEALSIRRERLIAPHLLISESLNSLGNVYQRWGFIEGDSARIERAMPLLRESLEMKQALVDRGARGVSAGEVAEARLNLSHTLFRLGRLEEAESEASRAVEAWREVYPDGHPYLANGIYTLAYFARERAGSAEGAARDAAMARAVALAEEALAMQRRIWPGGHEELRLTEEFLAEIRGDAPAG